jgi:hypothetical protein
MAQVKHRPFNADRFLDKFGEHEDVLWAYVEQWQASLPAFPEERTLVTFKDYLKTPPNSSAEFEKMIEGLYKAHDLSTKHGHEILFDALDQMGVNVDPGHDLHVQVLALKVLIEEPSVFELATNLWTISKVDKFVTYMGREPKEIPLLEDATIRDFETQLRTLFAEHKGDRQVLVRHFKDGEAVNFIVYHEERKKAELTFHNNTGEQTVDPLIFRPVRQDYLTYLPNMGKIEIETPTPKDRDAMRKAFGKVCLEDEDFFEEKGAEDLLDFSVLQEKGFTLDVECAEQAILTEVCFALQQAGEPKFRISSKDVFDTLERQKLTQCFQSATIKEVKIKIIFPGNRRGKSITLSGTSKIAFNRSTHVDEVFAYLRKWGLLVE